MLCTSQVEEIKREGIIVSTEYSKLPYSPNRLYRVDLGPNVATFARIDLMLDTLQREEPAKCACPCPQPSATEKDHPIQHPLSSKFVAI